MLKHGASIVIVKQSNKYYIYCVIGTNCTKILCAAYLVMVLKN